jgi:hypothetical protein
VGKVYFINDSHDRRHVVTCPRRFIDQKESKNARQTFYISGLYLAVTELETLFLARFESEKSEQMKNIVVRIMCFALLIGFLSSCTEENVEPVKKVNAPTDAASGLHVSA